MNLTGLEFRALTALFDDSVRSQRAIAAAGEMSLGSANRAYRDMVERGFAENFKITDAGFEALAPYKVENAIIMAAGLSSRFAPISYEKPKGVLRVRGEVLVERQIEQLRAAGIEDITVVVGYKKEYFFYLASKYGVRIVVNPEYGRRNNNSSLMAVREGIEDITVVVGYKKEYFFYLASKYGVRIVVNPEYGRRNNNSSLMAVREMLGNTYVCSSDDYFTENPFEPYVYQAYYAGQYQEGATKEWCMRLGREMLGNTYVCSSDDYFTENPFEPYVYQAYYAGQYQEGATKEWCMRLGSKDRIDAVTIGGSDAWYMMGHVYFDRAFSKRFVEILEREYDLPQTADKLWEQIYIEHIDELDMVCRKYDSGIIHEFDSLDELREFDPFFLENVDSEVFDNIVSVLGCEKSDVHDVYPLKQGITNLSCHFAVGGEEYVYRYPGVGTEQMIDRSAEMTAQRAARDMGIDATFVYGDPDRGWKISHFIPECTTLDPHDAEQGARAMHIARSLHESGVEVERRFDFFEEGKRYEAMLREQGRIEIPGYDELASKAAQLKRCVEGDNAPVCLTHNDFFDLNFLVDRDGDFSLIDWEYAGMSDYASDFGTYVVCCKLSEDEAVCALESYFGREPSYAELRHNFAYVGLAGWCWYVWSLAKEAQGDFVGEWLYVYYDYAVRFIEKALAMYSADFETPTGARERRVPARRGAPAASTRGGSLVGSRRCDVAVGARKADSRARKRGCGEAR